MRRCGDSAPLATGGGREPQTAHSGKGKRSASRAPRRPHSDPQTPVGVAGRSWPPGSAAPAGQRFAPGHAGPPHHPEHGCLPSAHEPCLDRLGMANGWSALPADCQQDDEVVATFGCLRVSCLEDPLQKPFQSQSGASTRGRAGAGRGASVDSASRRGSRHLEGLVGGLQEMRPPRLLAHVAPLCARNGRRVAAERAERFAILGTTSVPLPPAKGHSDCDLVPFLARWHP